MGQVQSGQIVKLGPNLDSLPLLILEKLRAESPTYTWNYIYTFWGSSSSKNTGWPSDLIRAGFGETHIFSNLVRIFVNFDPKSIN